MKNKGLFKKILVLLIAIFAFFALPSAIEAFEAQIKEGEEFEVVAWDTENENFAGVDLSDDVVCFDNEANPVECNILNLEEIALTYSNGIQKVSFVVENPEDLENPITVEKTYYKSIAPLTGENIGAATTAEHGLIVSINGVGGVKTDDSLDGTSTAGSVKINDSTTIEILGDDGFGGLSDYLLFPNEALTATIHCSFTAAKTCSKVKLVTVMQYAFDFTGFSVDANFKIYGVGNYTLLNTKSYPISSTAASTTISVPASTYGLAMQYKFVVFVV